MIGDLDAVLYSVVALDVIGLAWLWWLLVRR